MTFAERFWEKVEVGPALRPELGPCWVWAGSATQQGYGHIKMGSASPRLTHRVALFLVFGTTPDRLALHRCDNPPCVRPSHLFEGSHLDNAADMTAKGRHGNTRKTHCVHGHALVEDNVYRRPNGGRSCRACLSAADARYRSRSRVGAGHARDRRG